VETRNITLNLPSDLIRKAKVYAAEHNTTINSLVRDIMQEALSRENRMQAAVTKLLNLAARGPYFTTDPRSIRREELHERR
jgi:plasmid stability protein